MCTRLWLKENQMSTKKVDFVDPLDVNYDKDGKPWVWVNTEPKHHWIADTEIIDQWGRTKLVGRKVYD